jgi:thymidylate synthase ThyX
VSQRYVEVKDGNYIIPALKGEALNIYQSTIKMQIEGYKKLIELLKPVAADAYYKVFPGRRTREKYNKELKKKAQEIARYVIPIGNFAYLYHTISGITLLRYYRLCDMFDVPAEQKVVVKKMVEELLKVDPLYKTILEEPIDIEDTPEFNFFIEHYELADKKKIAESKKEFDEVLGNRTSKLVDYKINNEKVLADSVREVLGIPKNDLTDKDAIDLVLNASKNKLLGESLTLTSHSKLSRCMYHPHYTFRKKLSHTADSQDQRHRMTPASRPCFSGQYDGEPDFITPGLVKKDPKSEKYYNDIMLQVWDNVNKLISKGVSFEDASYLLPNAVCVRFTESSDLLNLHHKHEMRLCYNAQEEIWHASMDEAEQIREVNPLIGKYLLPPCTVRYMAGSKPICPEGDRYCGVQVWKLDISEYERVI